MIGIIVADKNEIFINQLKIIEKKQINQFTFLIFKVKNKKCVIINSGIGIANAAAATQSLINNFKVKTIYNYGSVGANNNLEIYDLIAPLKIFYHDVFTPWYKRGQTPKEKDFYKNSLSLENNNNLASGSSFTINKDYWNKVKKDLNVDIIDMEAAAIAQICYKNKISLKVIKCVSDIIGQNNKTVEAINLQIKKAGKRAFLKTLEILTNQI